MIILGLGSNVGDRLKHLRTAIQFIKDLESLTVQHVSPVYHSQALLPENAPAHWEQPFLNLAIRCKTHLDPVSLLQKMKQIEMAMGRENTHATHWGPRVIDIDILAWESLTVKDPDLTIPHPQLTVRPFALWPLADLMPLWQYPVVGTNYGKSAAELVEGWGSRFSGDAPLQTRQINQRVDTPQLVGILNITPNSFSDGGLFLEPEKAYEQAERLVLAGASVIDIGAESTAPHTVPLTPEEEWMRLERVLTPLVRLKQHFIIPPLLSVDTRHATTAAKALKAGADWINDVTGLEDPAMQAIVAASAADCVVMHHQRIPASHLHTLPRQADNVKLVYDWAEHQIKQLTAAGIAKHRIIIDPGIGFGKQAEHSLELIKQVGRFKSLGVRILIGHSRKSFHSLLTPHAANERDLETTIMSQTLAKHAIDYIRVHNVDMCARAFRTEAALIGVN